MMKFFTFARLMIVLAVMSLAAQVQAAQVYLDVPSAYNVSNPRWLVWAWDTDQQGEWVYPTAVLSNGLIEFDVTHDNFQFARVNPDDYTVVWNRTVDLTVIADATYTIYTITGWGANGVQMPVNATPFKTVYLDASAVTQQGNVWYAWSYPSGGNGSWYGGTPSGNKLAFNVPSYNDMIIFVRMNANGAPSWDNGIKLNQTQDLSVQWDGTYVITDLGSDRMVGHWGQEMSLAQLTANEMYLPDQWVINEVALDGTYYGVYFIASQNMLILRSDVANDADHKWYQNENDAFYQNLRANGYDFHVYKKGSLYKQNNWVALQFPNLSVQGIEEVSTWVGHYVSGIVGKLNVSNSFDITLELTNAQMEACTVGAEVIEAEPEVNTYSVPFFNLHDQGRIYNDNMRNPYDANYNGDLDYLMEGPQFLPIAKPNEVCTLEWAILKYDQTNHNYYFDSPEKRIEYDQETGDLDLTHSSNIFNLKGRVDINFTYCDGYNPNAGISADDQLAGEGESKAFQTGMMHTVIGLVKTEARTVKSPQWGPRRINAEPDPYFGVETKDWDVKYEFYPLKAPTQKYDPITGVTDVVVDRNVTAVTYYNLSGQGSSKPFAGINIVKTTYSDGTSSVIKQLMK